jgi:hypothetical protein
MYKFRKNLNETLRIGLNSNHLLDMKAFRKRGVCFLNIAPVFGDTVSVRSPGVAGNAVALIVGATDSGAGSGVRKVPTGLDAGLAAWDVLVFPTKLGLTNGDGDHEEGENCDSLHFWG